MKRVISCAVLFAMTATPFIAGAQTYDTWSNPTTQTTQTTQTAQPRKQDERLPRLIDDLNKLIDAAEKQRAGDPRFLRDLRDLARRYDWPWRVVKLHDNFRDGNFTANPVWTVAEGDFWVDKSYGLRSQIRPVTAATTTSQPQQQTQQQPQQPTTEELAVQILGNILGGGKSSGSQKQTQQQTQKPAQTAAVATRATIRAAQNVTNAFALDTDVTTIGAYGNDRMEIGLYQGQAGSAGYRVAVMPNQVPSLQLLRISSRGSSIIDSYDKKLPLADGKAHRVEWTRDSAGEMVVTIDGAERMKAVDRGFRDPFGGVLLTNFGGDYAIRSISVNGIK